jgi:hypothetical protein
MAITTWIVQNMLLMSVLALIFFFGDVIYGWLVKVSKNLGGSKIGGFIVALLLVIVLSLMPVLLQGWMNKLLTFWGIIVFIIAVIVVCYLKYRRKF